jgi:hypothetical protein
VPKELGGMGQNHVAAAMAVETIARLRLPVDRHVLHHASGRGRGGLVPPSQQPSAEGHPQPHRQGLPGRHALLFRSETASHFWYPVSPAPRRSTAAGRSPRKPPGPPPAASPTGTSCRPPRRTSAATTPTCRAS